MSKRSLFILILLICLSGCGVLYTEDQVNATVVSKIKEVAGMQKVNVTVETIIVKEYIVITATPEATPSAMPMAYPTVTPIGFDRLKQSDIYAGFSGAGFTVRQTYYELGEEEIGDAADWVKEANHFSLIRGGEEIGGTLYVFSDETELDQTYAYLTSQKPGVSNRTLFRKANILIELDPVAPDTFLSEVRAALEGIR